jgi:hypothetical protein
VNRFTLTKKFRSEILTPPVVVDDQPAIVRLRGIAVVKAAAELRRLAFEACGS